MRAVGVQPACQHPIATRIVAAFEQYSPCPVSEQDTG